MDEDCDVGDNGISCCFTKGIALEQLRRRGLFEAACGENDTTTKTPKVLDAEVELSHLCVQNCTLKCETWLASE